MLDHEVSFRYRFTMKIDLLRMLKRRATRILSDLRNPKGPILINEREKPSTYIAGADASELIQGQMAILEGIARGEKAVVEKRTCSYTEAKRKMKKWLDYSG